MKKHWKKTPKQTRNKIMNKISYAILGVEISLFIGTLYGYFTQDLTMTLTYLILFTASYPIAIFAVAGLYLKRKREQLTENPLQNLGGAMSQMAENLELDEDEKEEQEEKDGDGLF